VAKSAERWVPVPELHVERDRFITDLKTAAAREEEWLIHPSSRAIWLSRPCLAADVALAASLSRSSHVDYGEAHLREILVLWSPSGQVALGPGHHRIADIAEKVYAEPSPYVIDVDVFADAAAGADGFPFKWTWHGALSTSEVLAELRNQVVSILRAVTSTSMFMPSCMDWIRAVTRVAVLLRHEPDATAFRCGSRSDLPGLVYLDTCGGALQIFEALVHESAHHHLRFEEANGPLIDPTHTRLYDSPLRRNPRPLRGILLAFHALVYICAAYRELAATLGMSALRASYSRSCPSYVSSEMWPSELSAAPKSISRHVESISSTAPYM
jgi:hypothetical protein